MLAIVLLIALLSLAEANLKTPRTASAPSLSSSFTPTTFVTVPSVTTITPSCAPPVRLSGSSPALQPTGPAAAETRCTALPAVVPPSASTGTASNPEITPSPEFVPPGANFHEIGVKFVQTTYWSCATFPLETHCGWHEPILDAGAGRMRCDGSGQVALRAGVVAGIIAGGMVLGI